jgi:OCT family organic cation transporter-like MFS transporter 18
MLFLSKLPAVAMAGFLCAQTAIAKLTTEGKERVTALGRLTSAYTVGGVIGPFLGGLLGSSGDYFLGARYAVFGALAAAGLVFILPAHLPPPKKEKGEKDTEEEEEKPSGTWLQRAGTVLSLVGLYLGTKVVTGIANNMSRSAQPLILKDNLGFDEAMMGTIMSAQFGFGGFANAFLLGPLTEMLGGVVSVVVRNCIVIMGAVYLLQGSLFSEHLDLLPPGHIKPYTFIGLALFLSIFQYSLATSITADTTKIVPRYMMGTLMGIEHSMFSVAGIIGPLIGTQIFASYGISGLGVACGTTFFVVLAVWITFSKQEKAKKWIIGL